MVVLFHILLTATAAALNKHGAIGGFGSTSVVLSSDRSSARLPMMDPVQADYSLDFCFQLNLKVKKTQRGIKAGGVKFLGEYNNFILCLVSLTLIYDWNRIKYLFCERE